jgi:hypothetical protein
MQLYRMTYLQQLKPNTPFVERMIVMKRVQTQINIARSHGLPLLPNKVRGPPAPAPPTTMRGANLVVRSSRGSRVHTRPCGCKGVIRETSSKFGIS